MDIKWIRRLTNGQTIVSRLVNKLALASQADMPEDTIMQLDPRVRPMLSVDELLMLPCLKVGAAISVTSTGWTNIFTVTKGKRWRIIALNAGQTAGTFTMTYWGITDGTTIMPLVQFAASTTFSSLLAGFLPIEQDWTVCVYVDTKTVNGTVTGNIYIEETDAY